MFPAFSDYLCHKELNMALKAVLFDMDGVIVDTEPLHRKAYFKMFEDLGIPVSEELYTTFAGASTQKVCRTLLQTFSLKTTIEEMSGSKRFHFKKLFYSDQEFDLLPGVRELMQHYYENNIKMVLASSATGATIDMVFEKFNLAPFFVNKISGADLKESKPNPEIFQIASKLAGESTKNCMVIEDSTNGILAARRADIFCAAYKSEHTHLQDYTHADIVVSEFRDLELGKVNQYFR